MSTPERYPNLSPYLRKVGVTKTHQSILRFLACIDCQNQREGQATTGEMSRMNCLPRGTADGLSVSLAERGAITRQPLSEPFRRGMPPLALTLTIEPSPEIRAELATHRPCHIPLGLDDNPAA